MRKIEIIMLLPVSTKSYFVLPLTSRIFASANGRMSAMMVVGAGTGEEEEEGRRRRWKRSRGRNRERCCKDNLYCKPF